MASLHKTGLKNLNICGTQKGTEPGVRKVKHFVTKLVINTVVSPTDRPELVHNRCVIIVFGDVFVLLPGCFECSLLWGI